MTITVYTCTTPANYVRERNLTAVATITGYLKDSCNVCDPDIMVEYNAALLTANYAYIPAFGRWYWFRKAPTIRGDEVILHLHVDVLYTYRSVILASPCIAARSSSRFNPYLPDSAVEGEAGYRYYSFRMPFHFQDNVTNGYVLTVAAPPNSV